MDSLKFVEIKRKIILLIVLDYVKTTTQMMHFTFQNISETQTVLFISLLMVPVISEKYKYLLHIYTYFLFIKHLSIQYTTTNKCLYCFILIYLLLF